ncbi:MAG: SRPBCC domain-containing protein [Asgard group archaeon]|nr:SRPBCC domain-containing protein [Asgard group archaeon]
MDKIIYHSIVLECVTHTAFEYFTDNKLLEEWLTKEADVEPEVGGKYELFWVPEDKENDSTIGCKILALQHDKFLSFEWKGPKMYKHFMNNVRPLTNVVVTFIPIDGGTEIHLLHTGWRDSPEWEEARLWFENQWELSFASLQQCLIKE